MAAGLLLAAGTELWRAVNRQALWWAAVWFALAVAVHQSSIIYAPLLLAIWVVKNGWTVADLVKISFIFAATGFVLVGSFELWTIGRYGLAAKIAANPSVAQRDPSVSLAANTFLVMLTSFLGWSPVESMLRWARQPDPFSFGRFSKESFWLVTSWLQVLAGTFLGAHAPLLVSGGRTLLGRLRNARRDRTAFLLLAASGIVVFLNGLLNPFYSSNGSMQTGLVGLGLAGFLALSVWLAKESPQRWSWVIGITTVCCTLPWLALNLGVSSGLRFSPAFRSSFISGSEGDWDRLQANNLIPLGLTGFPQLQLGLLILLVIGGFFCSALSQRFITYLHAKVLHKFKPVVGS